MENFEYLKKLKKDNFREFVIKDAKADLGSRRLLALEIIAEELCIANKLKMTLAEDPIYVSEDIEANNISRQAKMAVKELEAMDKIKQKTK